MLPEYQLKIAHLYNISIGNFSDKKKLCASLRKLLTFPQTRIKTKRNTSHIRIQSIAMVKIIH